MAGDWLKMEVSLPEKPEILFMSAKTGLHTDTIIGKCFRVWRWFDQHTSEGHARGVTNVTLLSLIGHSDDSEKFLSCMVDVGWLVETEDGISLPNFDYHNGETAKSRALATKRKQKQRSKSHDDVTEESRPDRDKTVTREEKRREEVKQPKSSPDGFDEFWSAYPRKSAKGSAEKAWSKIRPNADLLKTIIAAVESAKLSPQWQKDDGQFIPHPATWLNQKRWEDETVTSASSPVANEHIAKMIADGFIPRGAI